MTKKVYLDAYSNRPLGIAKNRGCTDVTFLILFVTYWVGMYIVAGVAISTGDPRKLIIPQDSEQNYCGVNNTQNNEGTPIKNRDFTKRPYLYFINPQNLGLSAQICIEECPSLTKSVSWNETKCAEGVTPINNEEFVILTLNQICASYVYSSTPVINRCIPTAAEIPPEVVASLRKDYGEKQIPGSTISTEQLVSDGKTATMQVVADIVQAKWIIVSGVVASLFISFAYLILIKWFAKFIVWSSLIVTNLVLIGFSVWLYFFYTSNVDWYNNRVALKVATDNDLWENRGILGALVLACLLTGIILCVTIFLRKRIKIGIEIIKEAAKAVGSMPLIVTYPLFNLFFIAIVAAYFIIIYLYMITPSVKSNSVSAFGKTIADPNMSQYIQWYHIFGCIWTLGFFNGICQITFSGAIGTYYWTFDKKNLPSAPIIRSLYRTIRYHLGSVCLGSILLAIVQMLRFLLYTLKRQMIGVKNIAFLSCLFCCADCCLSCLEGVVKWINKQAYIQIAIVGKNFCISAKDAFGILMRNCLRLIAVDLVSWFVLLLGKLSIVAATYFSVWGYIKWKEDELGLTFTFVPAACAGVGALIIANAFLSVYDSAIDTIFICFLEDSERNDGSYERPYFMSKSLQRITNVRNKAIILVGGFGTRLRPLTFSTPKPLVDFANKPMIMHQIKALVDVGVKEIILAVNYQPDVMLNAMKKVEHEYNVKITFSIENEPLGTAGPLALARDILSSDPDPFFVLNSDVICKFPFKEFLAFHKSHGGEGTLMVTPVDDPSKYGVVVKKAGSSAVERFVEKPKDWVGDEINAGIYILNPSVLDRIELRPTSIEKEVFPRMARDGQLHVMNLEGFWADIGQPKDFLAGTTLFLRAKAKISPSEFPVEDRLAVIEDFKSNGIQVTSPSLIHPSAKIGKGSKIGPNVVVGQNVVVGEGVRLSDCVLMPNCSVKDYAFVKDSIVGWHSTVGKWARLAGIAVLGEDVHIKDEIFVNGGKVLPHKSVTTNILEPTIVM